MVRNQQGNERVALVAAGVRGYSGGNSRNDLEKITAIHCLRAVCPSRSKVASGAILRRVLLPVASETRTHVVSHRALRNRGFGEVPMTSGTGNARPIMWRMAELHMSIRREAVDAYPRNFDVLVGVLNHFLDFRLFPRQLGVTEHAFSNRWDASGSAIIGPDMAIDTLQSKLHVSIVRECDRLLGRHHGRGPCGNEPRASHGLSKSPRSPIKQFQVSTKKLE